MKIGKSNNVFQRAKQLSHWGSADYKNSYSIKVPIDEVFKLEKFLGIGLNSFRIEGLVGEGSTEIFSLSALDSAKKLIKLYVSINKKEFTLRKGISIPAPNKNKPKQNHLFANRKLLQNLEPKLMEFIKTSTSIIHNDKNNCTVFSDTNENAFDLKIVLRSKTTAILVGVSSTTTYSDGQQETTILLPQLKPFGFDKPTVTAMSAFSERLTNHIIEMKRLSIR